jgi:hypothetical protein
LVAVLSTGQLLGRTRARRRPRAPPSASNRAPTRARNFLPSEPAALLFDQFGGAHHSEDLRRRQLRACARAGRPPGRAGRAAARALRVGQAQAAKSRSSRVTIARRAGPANATVPHRPDQVLLRDDPPPRHGGCERQPRRRAAGGCVNFRSALTRLRLLAGQFGNDAPLPDRAGEVRCDRTSRSGPTSACSSSTPAR